jgi:cyanophycinase-like exopeptidase
VLNPDGQAKVLGKGAVYFMTLDHRPEICQWRKPLTVQNVKILKVQAGPNATFDFSNWTSPTAVAQTANVNEGTLTVTNDSASQKN